ncbi:hypothetical protein [Plantactinospora endophytica]|uniref:hypothetical protein n=1 Tax=Plantactinospora endophytica TaxID=673535 RepID=UPI003643FF85
MSRRHRLPIRHYRAWYFLWIFCSCGRRWRCPRSLATPRRPGPPPADLPTTDPRQLAARIIDWLPRTAS